MHDLAFGIDRDVKVAQETLPEKAVDRSRASRQGRNESLDTLYCRPSFVRHMDGSKNDQRARHEP